MPISDKNYVRDSVRIWLCECGCVHIESIHCRKTFTPAEFLSLLRNLAKRIGAGLASPNHQSCLEEACKNSTKARTDHFKRGAFL